MKRGTKGPNAGSFKAGKSGNPGGRKKVPPESREFLTSRVLKIIQEHYRMIFAEDTPPNVKATLMLAFEDRALGRPAPVEPPKDPLASMTDDEIRAAIKAELAK